MWPKQVPNQTILVELVFQMDNNKKGDKAGKGDKDLRGGGGLNGWSGKGSTTSFSPVSLVNYTLPPTSTCHILTSAASSGVSEILKP